MWWASQVALVVKNPTANAGDIRDLGSIPGLGRSSVGGHSNPLQYSCLENLKNGGDWQATIHEVTKSQILLKWLDAGTGLRIVILLERDVNISPIYGVLLMLCVYVCVLVKKPFLSCLLEISPSICVLGHFGTLWFCGILFVDRWRNGSKVSIKFLLKVRLKPRSPKPLLQCSKIQIRQAKPPTLTAIVWRFQGNSVFKKYFLWPLWVFSISVCLCVSHRIADRVLCPTEVKGKRRDAELLFLLHNSAQ